MSHVSLTDRAVEGSQCTMRHVDGLVPQQATFAGSLAALRCLTWSRTGTTLVKALGHPRSWPAEEDGW